jgi:putative membrane protein
MIRRKHSGLLVAAALGAIGLAWVGPSRAHEKAHAGEEQSGEEESSEGRVSECSPAQVAGILHVINQSSIATARLALSKSQNDDVREFAQKTIDSHTKLEKRLTDALEADGITPANSDIATRLATEHEQVLEKLGASTQFDRDYAAHEVLAHASASGLFHAITHHHEAEEENGSDASAVFAKARAMFAHHERRALELELKVAGSCGTATSATGNEAHPAHPAAH